MDRTRRSQTPLVRAIALDGALRSRVVGLAESLRGPSWIAVLLEEGGATFQGAPRAETIAAPALAWRPWADGARLVFSPGAVGVYALVGPTVLANATGHVPESRDLRDLADHGLAIGLTPGGASHVALKACFDGIVRETRSDDAAAPSVIEAYLRIILVELQRSGAAGVGRASPAQRIFNRFSGLVERRYRERWTVEDYAAALGLSRDRLGDICQRVRGLGPKELIDRRVTLEARNHLENSSSSIQQIAGLLGFQSPAQFSRFFHRTAGQPPGRYRAAFERRESPVTDEERLKLYEWP